MLKLAFTFALGRIPLIVVLAMLSAFIETRSLFTKTSRRGMMMNKIPTVIIFKKKKMFLSILVKQLKFKLKRKFFILD